MYLILEFFRRSGFFLTFLGLEVVALVLITRVNSYHQSFFGHISTEITGFITDQTHAVEHYFSLDRENEKLVEENLNLRKKIEKEKKFGGTRLDSVKQEMGDFNQKYKYFNAQVINNSIALKNNFFTLNKGSKDGVENGMGIITSRGVIGLVVGTSKNYARVSSVLNKKYTRISGRIKNKGHFGTLIWDGEDYRYLQLTQIPKYTAVEIGDTIETYGTFRNAQTFPAGIGIGTVKEKKIDQQQGELILKIKLFEDLSNLNNVYVVQNVNFEELRAIEQDTILLNNASTDSLNAR